MQIKLRYGNNRPDKRRCCAIFPANCNLSRMQKHEAESRSITTPSPSTSTSTIQIRLFTGPITDCDTVGAVRLSLHSSDWGNKERSVWTAAKTLAHSGSLLAVSTSSPGVSHTRLTSCFCQRPRQLLSSLHGNGALVAEVCCLNVANHDLSQLYIFWYAVILDRHPNQTENKRLKGVSCEGSGEEEKDLHSLFFFKPLKKLNEQTLCFYDWINRTDWSLKENLYFWIWISAPKITQFPLNIISTL